MRFLADGPVIPQALLELRDSGQVVFFCGAGVSIPAGFPSFLRLTELIIDELDAAHDAPERKLLAKIKAALNEHDYDAVPAIDQLMGALQREYGILQVEAFVAKHLRSKRKVERQYHEAILKLSTDRRGITRLVTTNFDSMFELARPKLRWCAPPIFPSLSEDDPLDGLVYLHGRLAGGRASALQKVQGLVLGSADFGRAYLADGRTLRFVSQLFRNYVVVFLGYAADDPPIRYLLEGLRSLGNGSTRGLYAFVDTQRPGMTQRWRDRGVEPISYLSGDNGHSGLWNSLEAWASRASDPERWQARVLKRGLAGPTDLASHERGQIVSIVRSPEGARAFAESSPLLPASWLCVFDPVTRYAKPASEFSLEEPSEEFDPLQVFGLDDDPPRRDDAHRTVPEGAVDVLSTLPEDEAGPGSVRLAGNVGPPYPFLPARLIDLGRWIEKVSNDPVTAWWAASYTNLHPVIRSWIESAPIFKSGSQTEVGRFWQLYLEEDRDTEHRHDFDLHQFFRKARESGWTRVRLREFQRLILPELYFERPWRTPKPPMGPREGIRLDKIARIKVRFPRLTEAFPIPNKALEQVVRAVAVALEHGASLLSDADERWHNLPSLFPQSRKKESYRSDDDEMFLWFSELFLRLAKIDLAAAKRELAHWPKEERFFFLELRLWAWSNRRLIDHNTVANALLDLPAELFWESDTRRELLFAIRARWSELTLRQRSAIESRLLAGPPRWHREKRAKHSKRAAITAAIALGWLQLHRCTLSNRSRRALPKLRRGDPEWKASWDARAADSHESSGGWVGSDTDPKSLETVALAKVIDVAMSNTKSDWEASIEYDPFRGLVSKRPVRALSALACRGRANDFPLSFWRDLLTYWPAAAPPRATCLLGLRVAALPTQTLDGLVQPVSWWLREHAARIYEYRPDLVWKPWDRVFGQIKLLGAAGTKSDVLDSNMRGAERPESRRTLNHALSGVVGALSEGLLNVLSVTQPKHRAGLAPEFFLRMESCLGAPGEGADHAVSVFCRKLQWLYWIDPNWTSASVLPLFDVDERFAEPAWNGYSYHNQLPVRSLFNKLKRYLLAAVAHGARLNWKQSCLDKLVQYVVVGAVFFRGSRQLISLSEARNCLRSTTDRGRAAAMHYLRQHVRNGKAWADFGRIFVKDVWPKELSVRSEATSRLLAELATDAEQHASSAVKLILPLIGPSNQLDSFVRHISPSGDQEEKAFAARQPLEALELLDRLLGSSPNRIPYGLDRVLNVVTRATPEASQSVILQRLRSLLTAH